MANNSGLSPAWEYEIGLPRPPGGVGGPVQPVSAAAPIPPAPGRPHIPFGIWQFGRLRVDWVAWTKHGMDAAQPAPCAPAGTPLFDNRESIMRNTIAKVTYVQNAAGTTGVRFTFSDGTIREFDLRDFSEAVRDRAAAYGLREALRDSYAGARSTAEAISLYDKRHATMTGGQYASPRGQKVDWAALALEAAQEMRPLTAEQVETLRQSLVGMVDVKAWAKAKKSLWATMELIKARRAAAAAPSADIDDLLDI